MMRRSRVQSPGAMRFGRLLLLGLLLSPSFARSASLDFELFDPAPVPQAGVMLESARPYDEYFAAGAYWQLQGSPVVEYRGGERIGPLVHYRWQQRLLFSAVPLDWLQVSLDLPVTLLSDVRVAGEMQAAQMFMNDMSLRAKALAWTWDDLGGGRLSLAGGLSLDLPTGKADMFGGSEGRFLQPTFRAMAEYDLGEWFYRAMLGYAERDDTSLRSYGLDVRDRIQYRAGAGWHEPRTDVAWFLELAGHSQFGDPRKPGQGQALELYAGAQIDVGPVQLVPGFSVGLTQGFGVPGWRFFTGVFYGFTPPRFSAAPPVEPEPEPEVVPEPIGAGTLRAFVLGRGAPVSDATLRLWPRATPAEAANAPATAPADLTAPADATAPAGAAAAPLTAPVPVAAAVTTPALPLRAGRSDESGFWEVTAPAGLYRLEVTAPLWHPQTRNLSLAGDVTTTVTLTLESTIPPPPGRFEFTVSDAVSGAAVSAGTVTLRRGDFVTTVTFLDARWTLEWPTGTAWERIRFDAEGYQPVVQEFDRAPAIEEVLRPRVLMVPLQSERRVVVTQAEIVILDKINFATGSDRITPDSQPVLEGIAEVLRENPDVHRVVISGHTDSVGRAAANQRLSQRRAESVRRTLVELGVEPARLEARGYGPDRPIADNATAEGRAENRRVEFRIDREDRVGADADEYEEFAEGASGQVQ